ncbi:hypothetical protein [Methylibium sp.]|uniref:hypothetical protein n=1 Tax=Methylibium sp. TaxID=2067992 RepID=UPI003D0F00FB
MTMPGRAILAGAAFLFSLLQEQACAQLMLGHAIHSDDGGCHVSQTGHELHFTTYVTPPDAKSVWMLTPHCEVIPTPGLVQVTVVLVDQSGRQRPIAAELVRMRPAAGRETERILKVPARTYDAGLIELSQQLNQAGAYELRLDFGPGQGGSDLVSIPFRIEPRQQSRMQSRHYLLVLCAMLVATGVGAWAIRRRTMQQALRVADLGATGASDDAAAPGRMRHVD